MGVRWGNRQAGQLPTPTRVSSWQPVWPLSQAAPSCHSQTCFPELTFPPGALPLGSLLAVCAHGAAIWNMREKIKPEAVAPARRQLAGQEEKPGESTVDSRRHKDVWGPQEGEPRAVIKTACADCRGSSVGYGLQEKLGLWEEGSPGEAGTSQLWRRRHRSRPGTGASKERDCRVFIRERALHAFMSVRFPS